MSTPRSFVVKVRSPSLAKGENASLNSVICSLVSWLTMFVILGVGLTNFLLVVAGGGDSEDVLLAANFGEMPLRSRTVYFFSDLPPVAISMPTLVIVTLYL